MKKITKNLLVLLTMVVLCFAVVMTVGAEDRTVVDSGECGAQGDNVIWTLYDDGELVISGEGEMKDYVQSYGEGAYGISSTDWYDYDIYKVTIEEGVTNIGAGAFYSSYGHENEISSISIPQSVTSIGLYAFCNCLNLKEIELPETISEIGAYAFSDCESLIKIKIPSKVTEISEYMFSGCKKLSKIELGSDIKIIGDGAFGFCGSIVEFVVPDSVVSIGKAAFSCCENLVEFVIPDTVRYVGDLAFQSCINLKEAYIGCGTQEIGQMVFDYCLNLEKIIVDEKNEFYSNDKAGVLFNKEKTKLIQYPCGNTLKEYTVPNTVKIIDTGSFSFALNIERIILPDGVTDIFTGAFYSCLRLKNINLPKSIKTIDMATFHSCLNLTEITFPEKIETIGVQAVVECVFMENMYFKSMDTVFDYQAVGLADLYVTGISKEDFIELYAQAYKTNDEALFAEAEKYITYPEEGIIYIGTIYCHSGSTAEAYAIENGVDYVLTHFYEGEWIYDYDNMIRYRKCIHCDELETEQLETTTDSDVEIIEPVDPDTDFTVDVLTDYVIIEEALSNGIAGDFEVVKAFDITLKNKDGVHIQPDGTVKVKLPLNWSKDGVYKVYRVNDDGTLTDMNAYRQGSHMVFETDHFSIYVIVDESEKADEPVIPDEPVTPDEPSEEIKDDFFSKIFDFFRHIIDLIISMFR